MNRSARPPWFLFWHSPELALALAIALVLVVVLTIRYWPPLAGQIELWLRSLRNRPSG